MCPNLTTNSSQNLISELLWVNNTESRRNLSCPFQSKPGAADNVPFCAPTKSEIAAEFSYRRASAEHGYFKNSHSLVSQYRCPKVPSPLFRSNIKDGGASFDTWKVAVPTKARWLETRVTELFAEFVSKPKFELVGGFIGRLYLYSEQNYRMNDEERDRVIRWRFAEVANQPILVESAKKPRTYDIACISLPRITSSPSSWFSYNESVKKPKLQRWSSKKWTIGWLAYGCRYS